MITIMKKSLFLIRATGFLLCAAVMAPALAVDVTGLVYPLHDLILSASVSGAVASKDAKLGQTVSANQLLLTFDDSIQTLELERRKVILDDNSELQAEKERSKLLKALLDNGQEAYDTAGAISKDELSHMRAEYVTSRGKYEVLLAEKQREAVEYRAAERDREMRRIYAPVRGVITKTTLEVGEWAKQGDPVIHLVDASTCIIKFAIPLKYAAQLHTGEEFPISLSDDATVTNIKGKLTYFSTVADPASGLVEGRITFDNAKLTVKPGIKAVVHIKTATDK